MGALMRACEWNLTPLGPPERWPQSLRTTVGIVINSAHPMFIAWGPNLICLFNDSYRPILGDKHDWALGKSFYEVWADIWTDILPLVDRALSGKPTWSEDLQLFMERSGYREESYFTFSYSPIRDESGGVGGLFCACTETTSRFLNERRTRTLQRLGKAAVEAKSLEESRQLCMRALETNPEDVPFAFLYQFEGKCARLVGWAGARPGETIAPGICALDRPCLWPFSRAVLGETVNVSNLAAQLEQAALLSAWGDPITTAVVVPIVGRASSQTTAALVLGVNPRRAIDDAYSGFLEALGGSVALALATAEAFQEEHRRAEVLAELDRAKTVFFSNVSHEFRTPLMLMLGPLEDVLTNEGALPAEATELVSVSHRNALRLQKLVDTLLDFSRIEAGRIQALYNPTDLAVLTTDLGRSFQAAVERAGMRLRIDCPPLPQPVYVDREMWEKIVFNLLSNAFKFTLAGEICITLRAENSWAVLSVEDTGIGIAEQEIPKLFDRFYRVEGAQGRTLEGTGIGLALVQELVRLHGGTVQARSVPGTGSTFSVQIPFGSAHLAADSLGGEQSYSSTRLGSSSYTEEARRWLPKEKHTQEDLYSERPLLSGRTDVSGGKPRIVLADDNADILEYVARLLSPQYEVFAVSDGQQALAAVAKYNPDLVLCDVTMPNLDGFRLIQALRLDPKTVDTPVIILSARAGEEATIEGLQSGADGYLVKPFSARELLARVSGKLSLAKLRQEARKREDELKAETANVLESIAEAFIALDAQWRITYVNAEAERICGITRQESVGQIFWDVFREGLGTIFEENYRRTMTERITTRVEAYYEAHDNWFEVNAYPLQSGGIAFYFRQVTEQRRAKILVAGQKEAMELAISGASLPAVLEVLARTGQEQFEGGRAAVYLVSKDQASLRFAATVGMPESYTQAVDGFPIGPGFPSCGSAAYTGQTVIVVDVEKDLLWRPYLTLAREHDVRSCWSQPVLCSEGKVLGMFTLYHRTPREPSPKDLEALNILAHSAAILIVLHTEAEKRESAEQDLRASEARFRAAAQANSLLWTNNAKGEMEGDQPGWSAFTGQSKAEYQGFGWSKAIHPADAQPTIEAWLEAVAERRTFNFEHRVRRHDGVFRLFSIRAVPVLDNEATIREWVGVHNDITEKKTAEDELRESAARFVFIAESMPQMIFTARSSGEVDYFNRQWVQFTGLSLEEIKNGEWTQFIHPDDLEESLRVWQRSIQTGEPFQFVHRFRRSDSVYRWHLSRAHAMRSEDGNVSMWISSNTEIHDEKETQEALRRANSDLEQFAYSASHDLQEPLRGVSIFSELLARRYQTQLDGPGLEFLAHIKSGALRIELLVHDLLEYTQVQNLESSPPAEGTDANRVLLTVTANLTTAIRDSAATITSEPLPSVAVHAIHLQQLFQNLIGNGIKYRSTEPPRVHLKAEKRGEQWLFSSRDNGIGINPKYNERIFGLFKRLHTADEYPGTGIGLAICQRIVERYGGRIWVESELGKGSTFFFTLPA